MIASYSLEKKILDKQVCNLVIVENVCQIVHCCCHQRTDVLFPVNVYVYAYAYVYVDVYVCKCSEICLCIQSVPEG